MRTKRGKDWTDEEIEELRRMAAGELRVKTIAVMLRRTPEAVRSQARRSAVSLKETKLLQQCLLYGLSRDRAQTNGPHAIERPVATLTDHPAIGSIGPDNLPAR